MNAQAACLLFFQGVWLISCFACICDCSVVLNLFDKKFAYQFQVERLHKLVTENSARAPWIQTPSLTSISSIGLAVTTVQLIGNGIWFVESDKLAMGASLAVILANVWMKSIEASLHKPELIENLSKCDQNGSNPKVTAKKRSRLCYVIGFTYV